VALSPVLLSALLMGGLGAGSCCDGDGPKHEGGEEDGHVCAHF